MTSLKERFINKANIKHEGKKYKYDRVDYKNCKEKVLICCSVEGHGYFSQTPDSHLSGNGCPKCGRISLQKKQRSTPEYFNQKARELHGDKYEYPYINDEYENARGKITIICNIHGEFLQVADYHLSGNGCPDCGNITISEKLMRDQSEYLHLCNEMHKGKYDYTDTIYTGCKNDIQYRCKHHGLRTQLANSHLKYGCWNCAVVSRGLNLRLTTQEFTEMANNFHRNRFDYSKSVYINYTTPLIIICKIHGEFEQSPANHLSSGGCIKCSKTFFSKEQIQWLDYIKVSNPTIQYATYGKEHRIEGTRKHADGFIPETNQVLEFHGCYFHGCRDCNKDSSVMNRLLGKSFNELYERTKEKEKIILSKGYKYHELWQCKWKFAIKALVILQKKWKHT
jgi:hypothetical protein